jgi:uncharacterized integral membrane protein
MTKRRGTLLFVAYVVFFSWLDWILHRSIVFIVVVGGGLIVAALQRSRIVATLSEAAEGSIAARARPFVEGWKQLPEQIQRLLISLTPLLYFITRGQGSSGAGAAVAMAGAIVAAVAIFSGPALDDRLSGFYAARNRMLPLALRLLLAPVLGVLIAFLFVHGSLRDLPALFGGITTSPQSPTGMAGRFFLATLLAGACTLLLVRERSERK